MNYISKRRIKKALMSLSTYGETNNVLQQLSEAVSPSTKLEQAVFGVDARLQKRLRIQTKAANSAMECAAVRSHKGRLFAEFREERLDRLAELY